MVCVGGVVVGALLGASQGGRQHRTCSLTSPSRWDCQGPWRQKGSVCPGSGSGSKALAQSSPRGGGES